MEGVRSVRGAGKEKTGFCKAMNKEQKNRVADLIEEIINKPEKELDSIHYLGHINREKGQFRVYVTFELAKAPVADRNLDQI